MDKTETWLDVMPVIPLANCVPMTPLVKGGSLGCVDLADPQGFGYALRHVCQNGRGKGGWGPQSLFADIIRRHMSGLTTEGDRIEVARACAIVSA